MQFERRSETVSIGVILAACVGVAVIGALALYRSPSFRQVDSLADLWRFVCGQPLAGVDAVEPVDRDRVLGARTRDRLASAAHDPARLAEGAFIAQGVCASCHGPSWRGEAISVTPFAGRLEGLGADYIWKQLDDFREGRREWGPMRTVAATLTEDQRVAVAAYFAGEPFVAANAKALPQGAEQQGAEQPIRQLARKGDPARALVSCASCHGPSGRGIPHLGPRIAGRHTRELAYALHSFKWDQRSNDVGAPMRTVASQLSDVEIEELAVYYAGLGDRD